MLFWLTAIVLFAASILGGGTRAGFMGDVTIQLLAIPLLLASAWAWFNSSPASVPASVHGAEASPTSSAKPTSVLIPTIVALGAITTIALQLIPLPTGLWSALGSTPLDANPELPPALNHSSGWATLSLTPNSTWQSAAALIVPIAVFFAVAQLDSRSRLNLCWLILAIGALALTLGLLQIAQGPQSQLRFFEFTNKSEAVGFFANRNHFAAQLYATLLLAAVWFITLTKASLHRGATTNRAVFMFIAIAIFLVAIMAGLAMARSRAGIILAMAAMFGVLAMVLANRRASANDPDTAKESTQGFGRIAIAVLGFATLFAAQFGLHRMQTRFTADPLEDLRIPLTQTTFETALNALPFGTGLGSFVPVYATVEKSADAFGGYGNRAHNDFAEIFLETGGLGFVLFLIFAIWFLIRAYRAWTQNNESTNTPHHLLQLAATLVIILLLAHSFVDYPLRTTALAALFAFCGATLVPPPVVSTNTTHSDNKPPRRRSRHQPSKKSVEDPTTRPARPIAHGNWGGDVEWPQEWQKKPGTTDVPDNT